VSSPSHAALAVGLFAALASAAAAGPLDPSPYVHAQKLVDVGNGRRLNIYCSGSGSPAVVLDGAIGSSMYTWHKVQPTLSRHVRVCSYDRAGYGFSDPGGPPHTSSANVRDLHALLQNAHIAPPYILAAHSLNAFDARLFADRYRREVAGMVLIDPSDIEEDRFASIYGQKKFAAELAADVAFLRKCDRKAIRHELKLGDDCTGPGQPNEPADLDRLQRQRQLSPVIWNAVLSERTNLRTDLREVKSEQRSYGDLPLIVLTAGAAEDAAKEQGATNAQIAAAKRLRKELRDGDAALSNRGVHCVIPGASHYIQIEKPNVFVQAVLEVLRAGKTSAKPSCARLP
jgi:pimeloyl-ACP methyl ester carboxylesterase